MKHAITLSDDTGSASITTSGPLSASDVESLIADLASLRSRMTPPVAMSTPGSREFDSNLPKTSKQNDPEIAAARLHDGSIRLWIRNVGLGWLAFDMPHAKARAIADYIVANTPLGSGNFLTEDSGNRSRKKH